MSAQMSTDLSVIAPCYNEAGNIPELLQRIQRIFNALEIQGEIVLVNDGSKDETGELIDRAAREQPNVRAAHHHPNRGIAASWQTGLTTSSGTYVCLIDSDLQYQPEDIRRLYRELRNSHVDLAQGFRSSIGRLRDSRYILSKGLNVILNVAFGMHLRDNKSGFIITRREVLEDILAHRYSYRYFNTFIAVAAHTKGYSIREVETLFESRLVGQSFIKKFPLRLIVDVLSDTAKALIEYRILPRSHSHIADAVARRAPAQSTPALSTFRKMWYNAYGATMPLHHWVISRNALDYHQELSSSQWLPADALRELQLAKLRAVVNQAYYHVPYYRTLLQKIDLHPSDIRSLDDLAKIPLLDKTTVRQNLFFDLIADNHKKSEMVRIATSGSTGEPFTCFADRFQLEMRFAATLRGMEWAGYQFGDRHVRLWHQTLGMSRSQVLREKFDARLCRRMFVPAYEMTAENMEFWLKKIRDFRPVLLDGYAESFNVLALFLREKKFSIPGLRGIITSAQTLPHGSRAIIEAAFDCKVFDKYGSREFSGIAYQCAAQEGRHVVAENYIVEILRNGEPVPAGEFGEVVVTDLNNFCMPLIRYRLGDLARAFDESVPCACGRVLPRIGEIEGRVQSVVICGNARLIPGTFFAHLFKDYDYIIRQYQIVQDKPGQLHLRVVRGSRFSDTGMQEVLGKLREFIGDETQLDVEFVDAIPLVRTGKHQGVISRIPLDFQSAQLG